MRPAGRGLYDASHNRDACGFGFVARADGRRTRETIDEGIEILRNLAHRGAAGSDPETGDGAGMLLQIPDAFFRSECGIDLPSAGEYGVGVCFFSEGDGDSCRATIERVVEEEGQRFLGVRNVPVDASRIGDLARSVMPSIRQFFVGRGAGDGLDFERKLYVIRRRIHKELEEGHRLYVASLSSRTVVYKGLLHGTQLEYFYPDLHSPELSSALALVHSRFSTNTLGSWELAHPYRYMAHNGEFNTLQGNKNWMRARESRMQSPLFDGDLSKISPVIPPGGSDSAAFDNAVELLHLAGRSLPHSVAMMMPEAWENDELMDPDRRAFYSYHSAIMEPWDGPAAVAFTDGRTIGASLDRNGLRPARYLVTRDGRAVMASEDGVLDIPASEISERSRLKPGRMFVVDTGKGEVQHDDEVKGLLVKRNPYRRWISENEIHFEELPEAAPDGKFEKASLRERQRAFGYTHEDLEMLLGPMVSDGGEPVSSMGTDTPLAVLSQRPQPLFNYFKQLFAQVTNPPIDPLREELVMSLAMSLGPEGNPFEEKPEHCRRVLLDHPVLTDEELEKARRLNTPPFSSRTLSTLFPASSGEQGLEEAVEKLCNDAEEAVNGGATVLVLSDRGVSGELAPVPILLATSAVHHHLVRAGIRTRTTLVAETAEAREVQHFALLISYGAAAVNPYLAFETISEMVANGEIQGFEGSVKEAHKSYIKAIGKGLLKVMSKMGISTLSSYCGAQIFEAVGLDEAMVDRHFTGTASRVGGAGLPEIGRETLERHRRAFAEVGSISGLDPGGQFTQRMQGEYHQWNPESIVPLQRAVGTESFEHFKKYTEHFDGMDAELATLRSLFDFEENPIPIEEVESAKEIVKRFSTGAISLGSISKETHETLAVAMNRIGGRSNTGEGGEDPERYADERRSSIKQVASGRFGVTTEYLVNSDMHQIKIAQGSKPGEGGQIPGHKISEYIAEIRYSTPGVGLISPPPHHDIYSIEDLAQLIHDLKMSNPQALVSVKLVAEVGVGTIAAGVAKAKADHITISGHDGGTGASPLSSIKHAGLPWELGVAETQQVLVENDLRSRVVLQTDGQLKTGKDIVVAALLGAEDFGLSTAPLVSVGCIMMRVCHMNTCPVGIATQDPELRKKFTGTPDNVINYFFFLAEEIREYMARMGFRTFDEMVGRSEMLRPQDISNHWKAHGMDLSQITHRPEVGEGVGIRHTRGQDHQLDESLDVKLVEGCRPALERGEPVELGLPIRNPQRTVGGMLAGEMARRYGREGLPDDTIRLNFKGVAGQSFGAWATRGMTLRVEGTTNDYVGKGLSGGRLVVAPSPEAGYDPEEAVVIGNVALYGATSGDAYFRGHGGERFAVRNSGAHAVVEGIGDHGCEYMTGGVVVVLGSTGRNFAAGMSGGFAFVYDEEGRFPDVCNTDMVGLEEVESEEDIDLLRSLVERHHELTGSEKAGRVLENWEETLPYFTKVMPDDLKRILREKQEAEMGVAGGG